MEWKRSSLGQLFYSLCLMAYFQSCLWARLCHSYLAQIRTVSFEEALCIACVNSTPGTRRASKQ